MTDRFSGKTVIVTGAGSGIGRASAILFAADGARTVVVDRNEKRCARDRQADSKCGWRNHRSDLRRQHRSRLQGDGCRGT